MSVKTRTKIIFLVFLFNFLIINSVQSIGDDCSMPTTPPPEDYRESIVYDFPLNKTITLDFSNQSELFDTYKYNKLFIYSEFHHDSNVNPIESNYLNGSYLNTNFSAINFGFTVEKIGWSSNGDLIYVKFWWHDFNGTTITKRIIYSTIVIDDFNPIINCTNLNVTTEQFPVSFDTLVDTSYNQNWTPPSYKRTHWQIWGRWVLTGILGIFILSIFLSWLFYDDSETDEHENKESEMKGETKESSKIHRIDSSGVKSESLDRSDEQAKALIKIQKQVMTNLSQEHTNLVKENYHLKELLKSKLYNDTNFCPNCGVMICELKKEETSDE